MHQPIIFKSCWSSPPQCPPLNMVIAITQSCSGLKYALEKASTVYDIWQVVNKWSLYHPHHHSHHCHTVELTEWERENGPWVSSNHRESKLSPGGLQLMPNSHFYFNFFFASSINIREMNSIMMSFHRHCIAYSPSYSSETRHGAHEVVEILGVMRWSPLVIDSALRTWIRGGQKKEADDPWFLHHQTNDSFRCFEQRAYY